MLDQIKGFQLSTQQSRLWRLRQEGIAHRAQCAILLEGDLKPDALETAVGEVVNRHEILRTTFVRRQGLRLPLQVVSEEGRPSWRTITLTGEEDVTRLFVEDEETDGGSEHEAVLRATLAVLSSRSHILFVSLPSLCGDAWTLCNLFDEIQASYAATLERGQISDEPVQYAEFSEWQNELLTDSDAEAGRDFWRDFEAGAAGPPVLPFEKRKPESERFDPDSIVVCVVPATADRVKLVADYSGADEAEVLLACWQVLLSRLTGEDEITVGRVFGGRSEEDLQGVMGPLARTLPVRARVVSDARFTDILRQAAQSSEDSVCWQEYFGEQEEADLRRLAALPIAFEYLPTRPRQIVNGVTFSICKQRVRDERFKLKLSCVKDGDALRAEFLFDPNLFAGEDVGRLSRHFLNLLDAVAADPDSRVSRAQLLTEAERRQVVEEFNYTVAEFPRDKCFHELFEEQAARTPDIVAAVFGDARLTYSELDARANQLAHYLQATGAGAEALVGLSMSRSLEMLVGILAVMKAGAAYVPLDPAYPEKRLSFMLEDISLSVVLTESGLLKRFAALGVATVTSDDETISSMPATRPQARIVPANLAYVIHTSGSTGKPKGVMVTHRGLVNYLTWCAGAYRVAEGRGAPVHSSISFDLTVTSLFAPLLLGRSVELVSEDVGVEALAGLLQDRGGFSLIKITPAHLELLASLLPEERAAGATNALVVGGEALLGERLAFWQAHGPDTRVINEYGPTETVVGCCVYEFRAGREMSGQVPIGRPIANTQIYLLDSDLNPVPVYTPGEIYVGGEGLARGYLNWPDLTAERFLPNPFSREAGARFYRTGDFGRLLPDGNLEYIGRRDHQVKIRGHRLELGEIEAALAAHPAVRHAAVVAAAGDDVAGKQLIAYAAAGGGEVNGSELRGFLAERLPDYMLPAHFVILPSMPVTANGKIDRGALPPLPEHFASTSAKAYVAPRNPVEEIVVSIWADVLNLEQVGVEDNFFELGGHSLLAMQVVSRLLETFEVELPLRLLFEATTVEQLARVLVEHEPEPGRTEKIASIMVRLENISPEEAGEILEQGGGEHDGT